MEFLDIVLTGRTKAGNNPCEDAVYIKIRDNEKVRYFKSLEYFFEEATEEEIAEIKRLGETSVVEELLKTKKARVYSFIRSERLPAPEAKFTAEDFRFIYGYHSLIKVGTQFVELNYRNKRFPSKHSIFEDYSLADSLVGVRRAYLADKKKYSLRGKIMRIDTKALLKQCKSFFEKNFEIEFRRSKAQNTEMENV